MENATKALLIAAAVLIVIVVIALGVRLLASTGDTTEQAGTVANSLSTSTEHAVTQLQGDITNALKTNK